MTKQAYRMRMAITGVSVLALSLCLAAVARAQEALPAAPPPAPPPLKYVPREDRVRLDAEQDIKKRTQLSLKLAETRLSRAEQLTGADEYDRVVGELGAYQGLVDDALKFLSTFPAKKGKTRDNYKRLELALRAHIPRLETMRRATPASYARNFVMMIEYVSSAREQALDSFYDNTVLRGLDARPHDEKSEIPREADEKAGSLQKDGGKPEE